MTIHDLLKHAALKKASDLHLIVDKPPILRIEGQLLETDFPILNDKKIEELVMSLLSPAQQTKYRQTRELDISYAIKEAGRFRINLHWEKNNPGLVARLIATRTPTIDDLNLSPIVSQLARLEEGLILITGPTGSGKSTTLAAMINQINNERACHIITLEDPIEFVYQSQKSLIKQRQLGSDMLSFAEGLKHVLRQDPNVIMVGEMRDLETIAATITLAETGHFVLATLHTNSAALTIERIIDVFPPYQQSQIRLQLANSLRGVISQRLLPKKDGRRVVALEILINTPAIANLIRENKIEQIRNVIQTSAEVGMTTMDQDIKRLYNHGFISSEVAHSRMLSPENLDQTASILR